MKRGEIWLINLEPSIGGEIKKTRPGIIVNNDALGILPLKIIVPITDWKERYSQAPWMVKIEANKENNLTKTSSADTFQVRSISEKRFVRKIGNAEDDILNKISNALGTVLCIR